MARSIHTTIDLSLGSVTIFTSLRNPNLAPKIRPTELPFSQSSPIASQSAGSMSSSNSSSSAGSRPQQADASSESEFIGIEEVTDTQWAADPADTGQEEEGDSEAVELGREALRIQAVQQRALERERAQDTRKSRLAELKARRASRIIFSSSSDEPIDISSSPIKPSSGTHTVDSNTPESAVEPVTPHAGGSTPISWSPGPVNRTYASSPPKTMRKRKAHAVVLSESESEVEVPLSTIKRDKGKARATPLIEQDTDQIHPDFDAGDEEMEVEPESWEEDDEYDKAFPDFSAIDINFESLTTTATTSTTRTLGRRLPNNSVLMPPPPPPPPRPPLVPVSFNHSSLTEALDREPGLPMLSELSEDEQEFYRNHWRRGADRAEEKRDKEEAQPTRYSGGPKKTFIRKGAFRGGGRGRGRGKARKR